MDQLLSAIVLSTSGLFFLFISVLSWWIFTSGTRLKIQSATLMLYFTIINGGLIALALIFNEYWYAFIPILCLPAVSLIYYTFVRFFYFVFRLGYYGQKKIEYSGQPFIYVLTAYRETKEELTRTMDSLYSQTQITGKKYIVMIADGDFESAAAMREMYPGFKNIVKNAYRDWDGKMNDLEIISHSDGDWVYTIFIKSRNVGKRDSLVLVRTLAYNRLRPGSSFALDDMKTDVVQIYNQNNPAAEYIVGTDADTVFVPGVTKALLDDMQAPGSRPVDGTVGYIVPQAFGPTTLMQKLWVVYQWIEYHNAQLVRRAAQSRIYEKVSCLSGACQALYVPTMCETKLLREFNTPPCENPSLMASIMSFASEDRRACVLSLGTDKPRFRSVVSRDAIALTDPPMSLTVFASQRRRWSLGAATNDWWLFLFGTKMNIFERFFALVNVVSWALVPFYFATIIILLYTIITNFNMMLIYLGTVMLFNYFVAATIPFWGNVFTMRERLLWIPQYFVFLIFIPWIAAIVHFNGISKSWSVGWGKTVVKAAGAKTTDIKEIEMNITENV